MTGDLLAAGSGTKEEARVVRTVRLPRSIRAFDRVLSTIRTGHLEILCPDGTLLEYGDRQAELHARVSVRNQKFFSRALSGASLSLGETYVEGWWEVEGDRICDFLGILLRNRIYERVSESICLMCRIAWERIRNSPISPERARQCIESHYDLSNDFYSLILDPTLTYSCGYKMHPGDSLQQMQQQKYDIICRKLGLEGGRLLDVGCGWGGLLIHAGSRYRTLNAVGITLSQKQLELAKQRVLTEHLENRINVKLQDYRDARRLYDYIVSIGMFEHVGKASYPDFMRQMSMLLKPEGRGLLHTIAITDDPSVKPDPWIQRYIFPGSRLPRLQEIVEEMQKQGLVVAHVDNWKLHYAETLRKWKRNLDRNNVQIRALDPMLDDMFIRTWNYYFQACESGFRHSTLQLYQILFCKEDHWPLPMTMGSWV